MTKLKEGQGGSTRMNLMGAGTQRDRIVKIPTNNVKYTEVRYSRREFWWNTGCEANGEGRGEERKGGPGQSPLKMKRRVADALYSWESAGRRVGAGPAKSRVCVEQRKCYLAQSFADPVRWARLLRLAISRDPGLCTPLR